MPKIIEPKVEVPVLTIYKEEMTFADIGRRLRGQNIIIGNQTISDIVKNVGKRREAKAKGLSTPKVLQPSRTISRAQIRKVKLFATKENPPSQRDIAKRVKMSKSYVSMLIKKLGL